MSSGDWIGLIFALATLGCTIIGAAWRLTFRINARMHALCIRLTLVERELRRVIRKLKSFEPERPAVRTGHGSS